MEEDDVEELGMVSRFEEFGHELGLFGRCPVDGRTGEGVGTGLR